MKKNCLYIMTLGLYICLILVHFSHGGKKGCSRSKQGFKNIRCKNVNNKSNSQKWFEHTKLLCQLIWSPLLNPAFQYSHSYAYIYTESWNTLVTYVVIWRLIKQWSNMSVCCFNMMSASQDIFKISESPCLEIFKRHGDVSLTDAV